MSGRAPIVVIGGGTAGSTVVAHLAAHTTKDIVLIEPGRMVATDDESRFHEALAQSGVSRDVEVAVSSIRTRTYRDANALGGGSAINGMLLTGAEPEHLRGLTRMATSTDCGVMGKMLLDAGGEFSRLWWNRGRWNPGRAVNHLVEEGRVRIVSAHADRVEFSGSQVTCVVVSNEEIEVGHLVVSAGAISTPALMLRSGCAVRNGAIGRGLQNHPVINVPFELAEPSHARFDASVIYRYGTRSSGEIMMFAFERASRVEEKLGVLAVAVMTPDSVGRVELVDGDIRVQFNCLTTSRDRDCLIDGLERASALFDNQRLANGIRLATPHSDNFSLSHFLSRPEKERQEYVWSHVDVLSHATSSMSQAVDQSGGLKGFAGVSIADASILPNVPSETPAGPVTMEALRIARILGKELS